MSEEKDLCSNQDTNDFVSSDLLKNRVDIKAETILTFNHVFSKIRSGEIQGASTDARMFLVTPQGLVSGDIEELNVNEDNENSLEKLMEPVIISNRNQMLNVLVAQNPSIKPINDSSLIIVRNAKLHPWGNFNSPAQFQVLYLFSSDISGFTLGNFQNQ